MLKLELLIKWLRLIKKSDTEDGFTLVELIVVLVLIGILSAIALPIFLNLPNRGRLAEARSNLSNMARGQQSFYIDRGRFAQDFTELQNSPSGADTPAGDESDNFTYTMDVSGTSVISMSVPKQPSFSFAAARTFIQGASPLYVICNAPSGFTVQQMQTAMAEVVRPSQCPPEQ